MILLNSIFLVQAVSDEDVKIVLKKALFEYFENPNSTTLTLPETKDVMNFYLTTPKGQDNVDLSQTGSSSGKSIQTIFSKALINYTERNQTTINQTYCSSGWKCKTGFHRAYQSSNCNWQSITFCNYGCVNGNCKSAPINYTNVTQPTNYTTPTNYTPPTNQTYPTNVTNQTQPTNVTNQTYCSTGWKCKSSYYRAYQYSNCNWGSSQYCSYGCSNGYCNQAPSNYTNQTGNYTNQTTCSPTYLTAYRCSGNWKQRQYRNTDCSTSWNNYEYCSYGCSNNVCNSPPQNQTTGNQTGGNQTTCSTGWKCKSSYYRAYQYNDCNWGSSQYCSYGCSNGYCNSPPSNYTGNQTGNYT